MKKVAWMMLAFVALAVSGCAQKSESEKALDRMNKDAKKAMGQVKKDINNL